jgi:hypothetical protein
MDASVKGFELPRLIARQHRVDIHHSALALLETEILALQLM